jgi:hypothetical protein
MTEDTNRDPNGRWQKGHSANAGGLTRQQARIARMLEDMTEDAAQRLRELMASRDEQIALGAVKEWLHRMAPPPPKQPPVSVNVALGGDNGAAHLAALRARMEARRAFAATPVIDLRPDAAVAALSAPVREEP